MTKPLLDIRNGPALFDVVSYGRQGPKGRVGLSPAQIAEIDRTVRRVPEVIVKVLPKDSDSLRAVARHLDYIGRYGKLEAETDYGEWLSGESVGARLVADWDLDLDEDRREMKLTSVSGRSPKLVHKMPPGTPVKGVLEAARNFAREEFALKRRYALVLHTDEPHPHVHLVVKAVSEQGIRLNIRKATLRGWRREFARHLRDQGIAANATERAGRGETRSHKRDGIYRSMLRGDSTHLHRRARAVAAELLEGRLRVEPGKSKLLGTRQEVERAWRAISAALRAEGQPELASRVDRFADQMPPVRTEKEMIADGVRSHLHRPNTKDSPPAQLAQSKHRMHP